MCVGKSNSEQEAGQTLKSVVTAQREQEEQGAQSNQRFDIEALEKKQLYCLVKMQCGGVKKSQAAPVGNEPGDGKQEKGVEQLLGGERGGK